MSFIRGFFKIISGFVGAALMLGGVGAIFWGIYSILKGRITSGVLLILGGILVNVLAVYIGKFARGDVD